MRRHTDVRAARRRGIDEHSRSGREDVTHTPELLAALGLRRLTIGGEVTLLRDVPAYATGCKVIELD
jgi:hypothetical protein